ncbi:MAG: MauE/DoxX family redox-associated membrane protein [Pirellula sp.]
MNSIRTKIVGACAMIVAVVLWVASISHIANPYYFFEKIIAYDLPMSTFTMKMVSVVIPVVELGLASSLLTSAYRRPIFAMALGLFAVYTVVQGQALMRGLVIDCGCFGGFAKREVGAESLSIATALLAISLIGIVAEPKHDGLTKCE